MKSDDYRETTNFVFLVIIELLGFLGLAFVVVGVTLDMIAIDYLTNIILLTTALFIVFFAEIGRASLRHTSLQDINVNGFLISAVGLVAFYAMILAGVF